MHHPEATPWDPCPARFPHITRGIFQGVASRLSVRARRDTEQLEDVLLKLGEGGLEGLDEPAVPDDDGG